MKKVSGSVKLDLAQYNELAAFSQFASELDETTKNQLTRGQRTVEALKQKPNQPLALWKEAAILWAAKEGALDKTALPEVGSRLAGFLDELERKHPKLVADMQDGRELSDAVKEGLAKALKILQP
jgi:F-type H+-transporting ATPase subunit alpha